MAPIEFLRALWPATGLYCLATPNQKGGFRHTVVDTIEGAARHATDWARKQDVYFCMHTLKEPQRVNLNKPGGHEVRTHVNMHEAKCFFLDLDVEEGNTRKYDTQLDALTGLRDFFRATSLPAPMVTSSGGGLHVYWPLANVLPSIEWKQTALQLKALTTHYGLRADPTRISDQSSVLRVAGTFNHKHGEMRPVKVLANGVVTNTQEFLRLVDEAVIRAGIIANVTRASAVTEPWSNLGRTFDGPPPTIEALLTACPQLAYLAVHPTEASEPQWYRALGVVRFVEDGNKYAHKFSSGHPGYSVAATDAKLAQLESTGPTLCTTLADVCGPARCQTCRFFNHAKVRSPITAAQFHDETPAPIAAQSREASAVQTGTVVSALEIPESPSPFRRLPQGGIVKSDTNNDNDTPDTPVYEYDLYPTHIAEDKVNDQIQVMWRAVLPHDNTRDFVLNSDAVYDMRAFTKTIASVGIFPSLQHLSDMQAYMIAYVQVLQRAAANQAQRTHLGWTDNHDGFILPDRVLLSDGTVKPAHMNPGAQASASTVNAEGTLQRQVELMEFYNRPEYVSHQFFILASLASPIFFATGEDGVVVNASGLSGSSKSTALFAAASFWGKHKRYTINGTNKGMTALGLQARLEVLANLPVCVDEITNMPTKEQVDLVMGATQPGRRVRSDRYGNERKTSETPLSSIMMCSANSSLHTALSQNNASGTAGSMRVLELLMPKSDDAHKPAAAYFRRELLLNYGHIGPAFMSYVVQHHDEVKRLVEEAVERLDKIAGLRAAERFWCAEAAASFVSGRIATRLELLPFDVDFIEEWFISTQVTGMRDVVNREYTSPISMLAEFLERIDANTLVLPRQHKSSTHAHPIKTPHGELIARYEVDEHVMWVLRSAFKEYCAKTGASLSFVLKALKDSKVVCDTNAKKVLGANCPEYSKAQTYCICIDMAHRDMSGIADLKIVGGTQARNSSQLNEVHSATEKDTQKPC